MNIEEKKDAVNKLRADIAKCTKCSLYETRTNTVPGEGDSNARIMFIGEAPGKNEDEQGKPFIGRAGNIFSELLGSVGLTRNDIYLCNILKCRPPKNRNPLASEIQSCVDHLDNQIRIVNPDVIGTLGTFSTNYVFEKFSIPVEAISKVAGKMFKVDTQWGIKKIVPVFHPAVAIYNVHRKDELINHFKIFKQFIPDAVK